MFFVPIIMRFGLAPLAADLDLPAKNIRRWIDHDSIPAEWFSALVRSATGRGFNDITHELLASRAEARRLTYIAERKRLALDAAEH